MDYTVIMLNGRKKRYSWNYTIENDIQTAKALQKTASQPFVVNVNNIFRASLSDTIMYKEDYLGIDEFVLSLADNQIKYWVDKLKSICVVDTEWTSERNKEYNYECYIKMTLKPEYQQQVRNRLSQLINELEELKVRMHMDKEKESKRKEAEKAELMRDVESFEQRVVTMSDEGGITVEYFITVKFIGGEKFVFKDRNVFDFGRVINPCYAVKQDLKPGGLLVKEGDTYYWQTYNDSKGWYHVRPVAGKELQAYKLVEKYGGFAHAGIRI